MGYTYGDINGERYTLIPDYENLSYDTRISLEMEKGYPTMKKSDFEKLLIIKGETLPFKNLFDFAFESGDEKNVDFVKSFINDFYSSDEKSLEVCQNYIETKEGK